jgi:hypothetical protein
VKSFAMMLPAPRVGSRDQRAIPIRVSRRSPDIRLNGSQQNQYGRGLELRNDLTQSWFSIPASLAPRRRWQIVYRLPR